MSGGTVESLKGEIPQHTPSSILAKTTSRLCRRKYRLRALGECTAAVQIAMEDELIRTLHSDLEHPDGSLRRKHVPGNSEKKLLRRYGQAEP